jgi:putative two-component system hydrogenase maturation factor HypX/HoxX
MYPHIDEFIQLYSPTHTHLEIQDTYGSDVCIEPAIDKKQMLDSVKRHDPDIILCSFLMKRIPAEIWRDTSRLCLIVHPGIHGDRGALSIDCALKEKNAEWGVTVLQADEEMDAGDIWSTKEVSCTSRYHKIFQVWVTCCRCCHG